MVSLGFLCSSFGDTMSKIQWVTHKQTIRHIKLLILFWQSSEFFSIYTDFSTCGAVLGEVVVDSFSRHTQIFLLCLFIRGRGHSWPTCLLGSRVYHVLTLTSHHLGARGSRSLVGGHSDVFKYRGVNVDRDWLITRFLLYTHLSLQLHLTSRP